MDSSNLLCNSDKKTDGDDVLHFPSWKLHSSCRGKPNEVWKGCTLIPHCYGFIIQINVQNPKLGPFLIYLPILRCIKDVNKNNSQKLSSENLIMNERLFLAWNVGTI